VSARRATSYGALAFVLGAVLVLFFWERGCERAAPPGVQAQELPALPADVPIKLGYVFGDSLELLGAKIVSPPQGLRPTSRVEVTLYWRKRGFIPKGYRLFTHVLDEAGERVLNLDGSGALRAAVNEELVYPPSQWRRGHVYADSFAFWVPANLRTDSIRLVCGLFRGSERLAITSPARAPDRERATVATLRVLRPPAAAASSPTPVLWLPFRRAPITIDGKLDDDGWRNAASTGPLVNVATGEPVTAKDVTGSVKLVYDEQALFVGFTVIDEDLRGGFDPREADPHLWLKDTVEIMVDPDGDGDNLDYYEIQVGPQNLTFDSQFDAYNLPHTEPHGPFGHQEWSAHLESAVELRGTLDDGQVDDGYTVELAIPWASFSRAKRVPPTPADTWRMNFYAMQNNAGAAWSPILGQGNFHKASRFGRIRFAGRPGPAR